jgi:L-2-amino-thiazoline-4-carboxylic acid hydrolase
MKTRTVALVGAVAVGLVIARRRSSKTEMPYLTAVREALAERHGEMEADRLAARAQARYEELYDGRPRPAARVLRLHVERGILPALAFYRTLLEDGAGQDEALAEMEELLRSIFAGLRSAMSLFGWFPDPFGAFQRFVPWLVRLVSPSGPWDMEPVENSGECVGFDMHRCFYLDTLTEYGAPELAAVVCAVDDIAFAGLPPSITWERTGTLARGQERCDFRWRRALEPQEQASST